ncbi:hypothetical protein DTO013E5_1821 [Penicillium roqueforti]|nr:hypothetical protein DTO012A1_9333 [Penicillium roqueforti]KAI2752315.1 hypothetical protein DTO013F2_3118 [Penicillium roqueforti]KAI3097337.1 hypothetical protein CBS147333_9362 [Penicillium roqueforti]KAI3192574.1 hypothetical protein CBS147311_9139 [Penicillium roqueforti]KAI3216107.1 hypothetical protein DTO013E5_1821 [Penicillium roqueforti]
MILSILFLLSLLPFVKADDDWDDFTNNLATDLAPLITLFGERLTKQFLSESISTLDNVIFALSPLGVLTAVVSVIRVCGSSSLRAFVGRAQEGPAEAESELLPCVSESTAEVFNDGGITRVFGRPKIVEIVAWEDVDKTTGEKETKIGTLRDALEEKAWSCNSKVSPTDLPELDMPNLSLNKGIKRRDQFWFHCAAILGGILQTGQCFSSLEPEMMLTIQKGTVVFATLTVFVYPQHFQKNDKAVAPYAFPLYIIGTTLLFLGMFFCAFIMERSSKEFYLKAEKPSKIYWLQPGNQDVGDQVFNAFLAVNEGPESSMTDKLRYTKSIRDRRFDRKYLETYSTLISTILGFICQFVGLRGLHSSVTLAQLGSTFLMAIIRTCLRTERMNPDENKMKDDRDLMAHKQQELDCFAFYLEKVDYFNMTSLPDRPANIPLPRFMPHIEAPLAKQLIRTRTQLANLTSNSNHSSNEAWDEMPIRQMARNLAHTIESTMDLISGWGVDLGKAFEFRLGFECRGTPPGPVTQSPGTYSIGLIRCGDALRWKMEVSEMEAILGLWTWSLYKSNDDFRFSRLFRLVGLSEEEAKKEETYLYFHKWIFRQTEARLVPSDLIDDSRRLFGFEPKEGLPLGDLLVIRTENGVETMAAQDIFIQFLREICLSVKELGGEVDVVPGIQNSLLGSCTRIDELVSCFESHSLGSREDALLCIVPVLKNRNLLPDLVADCTKVRARREQLISQGKWQDAFELLRWLCQRSEGSQFQMSVYELGYLCRRALLNHNETIRKEGFAQLCKLLNSDIRDEFLQAQKISLPSDSTVSQDRIEWWRSFSSQLGWTAWCISTKVPGMSFMQSALKSLNAPESLPSFAATDRDLEDTQAGIRAIQDWLTLRDFDNTGFNRSEDDEDDKWAFDWAVENKYDGLLYFLMLQWVGLRDKIPALTTIGYTLAALKRSHFVIQVLLRQGTDIDSLDVLGRSALFHLADMGNVEGLLMLLDKGANPNGLDKASDGRPLIAAVFGGHIRVTASLLQYGANANVLDQNGMTPLWWAIASDYFDIVELLLSNGAGTESVGFDGLTPLLCAATEEKIAALESLINHGANINVQDPTGKTALMRAVSSEFSVPMLRLLLDKGADVHMKDRGGLTALDMAKEANFDEAIAILEPLVPPPTQTSFVRPAQPYFAPPPGQTSPNGDHIVPQSSISPPTASPIPNQPGYGYSNGEYPAPPSASPPPHIAEQNLAAFRHNQSIGGLSISSQTSPPATNENIPGGAPTNGQSLGAQSTNPDDVGTFNGGSYRISHRDTNSILTIQLARGCPLSAKPGAMIAMSTTITLRGHFSFSLKKWAAGSSMAMSYYTGPGEVLLGPFMLGDIIAHDINPEEKWHIGREAFLANTAGVHHEYVLQDLSKGFFSGVGFFVYEFSGSGIVWLQSFGAIIRKYVPAGENYYVDTGHLVAWNCHYDIERVASGGLVSGFAAREGLACKFQGPGTVYLQTRNLKTFAAQLKAARV